jgi:hypothetical protein
MVGGSDAHVASTQNSWATLVVSYRDVQQPGADGSSRLSMAWG